MQPSTRDAIAYGTSTEPEIKELKEGEDPVLSGGNAGDQPVEMALGSTMDGFRQHRRRFRTIVGHGAIVATQTSRVVGRLCLDLDGAVTRDARAPGPLPWVPPLLFVD